MKKKLNWIWIVAAVLVLLAVIRVVVAYATGTQNDFWNWQYYGGPMMGAWMMPFGMIGMALFWGLVVLVLVRAFADRPDASLRSTDLRLRERLASGDITIQEYEALQAKLKEGR